MTESSIVPEDERDSYPERDLRTDLRIAYSRSSKKRKETKRLATCYKRAGGSGLRGELDALSIGVDSLDSKKSAGGCWDLGEREDITEMDGSHSPDPILEREHLVLIYNIRKCRISSRSPTSPRRAVSSRSITRSKQSATERQR